MLYRVVFPGKRASTARNPHQLHLTDAPPPVPVPTTVRLIAAAFRSRAAPAWRTASRESDGPASDRFLTVAFCSQATSPRLRCFLRKLGCWPAPIPVKEKLSSAHAVPLISSPLVVYPIVFNWILVFCYAGLQALNLFSNFRLLTFS
jgi:hypothetical protein